MMRQSNRNPAMIQAIDPMICCSVRRNGRLGSLGLGQLQIGKEGLDPAAVVQGQTRTDGHHQHHKNNQQGIESETTVFRLPYPIGCAPRTSRSHQHNPA